MLNRLRKLGTSLCISAIDICAEGGVDQYLVRIRHGRYEKAQAQQHTFLPIQVLEPPPK
jgi:hypothetical protein